MGKIYIVYILLTNMVNLENLVKSTAKVTVIGLVTLAYPFCVAYEKIDLALHPRYEPRITPYHPQNGSKRKMKDYGFD